MTTLMKVREWLMVDERIYSQSKQFYDCVNNVTVEVYDYLLDNVEYLTEFWGICDELDGC